MNCVCLSVCLSVHTFMNDNLQILFNEHSVTNVLRDVTSTSAMLCNVAMSYVYLAAAHFVSYTCRL